MTTFRVALGATARGCRSAGQSRRRSHKQVVRAADAGRGSSWSSRRPPCAASACRWPRSPSRSTARGPASWPRSPTAPAWSWWRGCSPRVPTAGCATRSRAVGPGVDAHYDKIHLFDAFGFRESDTVEAGREPVMIMVGDVAVGLTTCYDVRFPGLYTALADRGAQVTCVAASWGAGPGKIDQWRLLTRARALDSTTFVVAAGQADPRAVRRADRGGARPPESVTARRSHRSASCSGSWRTNRTCWSSHSISTRCRRPGRRSRCWPTAGSDRTPPVPWAPAIEYLAACRRSAVVTVPGAGLVEPARGPAGRAAGPRTGSDPGPGGAGGRR